MDTQKRVPVVVFTVLMLLVAPSAHAAGEYCVPLPPKSSDVYVSHFDDTMGDGTRVWGSLATYELSTGEMAEVYLEIDSNISGEVYLAIDGDVVVHATYSDDGGMRGPVVTSWVPPDVSHSPEIIAELMQESVGEMMINGMVPQEFPCSSFGKGVLKGAKYLWIAATAAAGATCCIAAEVGCPLCVAGAAAAGAAGADAADGYCD